MNHPLRCRCGTIKGFVVRPGTASRAVCYCKDCQAFAYFLERSDTALDAQGGTPIVATLPKHVHFTEGAEALACMSLSPRGLLRWYARCCQTPIANTPRDFKTHYVGLIESCLVSNAPSIKDSFGPVRMVINTQRAKGRVKSNPLSNLFAIVKVMKSVIGARISGAYKHNPFFAAGAGRPVAQPRVLTQAEREQITDAALALPSNGS